MNRSWKNVFEKILGWKKDESVSYETEIEKPHDTVDTHFELYLT